MSSKPKRSGISSIYGLARFIELISGIPVAGLLLILPIIFLLLFVKSIGGNSIIDGVTTHAYTELVKVTTASRVGSPEFQFKESDVVNIVQGDIITEATVIETDFRNIGVNGENAVLDLEVTNLKPLEVIDRSQTSPTSVLSLNGVFGDEASTVERSGEYFVAPDLEDNTEFEAEAKEFIDFTDIDPFSEGDL